MAIFNLRCPKHYPLRCNLLETEKENLERTEKYTAFLMYQFSGQDDYLVDTIKKYFHSPTYYVFDAAEETGLGIKICKICRLAQTSDFGIVVLTPENPNVYLEAGMMMGMGKRNLYIASRNILKAQKKTLKDIAFDLSDQLVIEHKNKDELLKKLEKEVPSFIDNVVIGTALERERRAYWRSVYNELNGTQKKILKSLSMVSSYCGFYSNLHVHSGIHSTDTDFLTACKDLINRGIIEETRKGSRYFWQIDPIVEPFIQEFLFEEE